MKLTKTREKLKSTGIRRNSDLEIKSDTIPDIDPIEKTKDTNNKYSGHQNDSGISLHVLFSFSTTCIFFTCVGHEINLDANIEL